MDLSRLNKSLKYLPTRMLCVRDVLQEVEPGMWFTSVDLKDAYFHIPIAPQHRTSVSLVHIPGQAIPISSPTIWPLPLSLCIHMVYASGTRTSTTGGNFDSPIPGRLAVLFQITQQVANNTQRLLEHVTALGLRVNPEKSCLAPCRQYAFWD